MLMEKLVLAVIGASWILAGPALADEPRPMLAELSQLLEQCVMGRDPAAATAALTRFTGKPTRLQAPAVSWDSDYYRAQQSLRIKEYHANILREVGLFILEHPAVFFQSGLPSLKGLPHRERLAPLFSAMVPYSGSTSPLTVTLGPLEPLISDEWLEAAKYCGAVEFVHSLRACRGQFGQMLGEYQAIGDEVGVFRLGELLGLHPALGASIQPEKHDSHTLALLLSAALSHPHRELDELQPVMVMLVRWEKMHPGLGEEVFTSISQPTMRPWCQAVAMFCSGQRKDALKRLCDLPTQYQSALSTHASLPASTVSALRFHDRYLRACVIGTLLSMPDCPIAELPELAGCMPVEALGGAVDHMLRYGTTDEEQLWRGVLLLAELLARKDRPEPLSECLRFNQNDLRRLHERFIQAGQHERAQFLQESSKSLTP